MKLNNIKIPDSFRKTNPNPTKIQECLDYYNKNGRLDKPITVNKCKYLIDGYVRYLVAEQLGLEDIPCTIQEKTPLYVCGIHSSKSTKRYWWVVDEKLEKAFKKKITIGDTITVDTKKGDVKIIVTGIRRLNNPPVKSMIRSVKKI